MRKIFVLLSLCSILLFSGCASYNAQSLTSLDSVYLKECPEIEGVRIGCKTLSTKECKTYLDRNVISKGFLPIQFTFENFSDQRYFFSSDSLSLPKVNPAIVAETVHTNTLGRIILYSIGGLYVPAAVDGYLSWNANKALDQDFQRKAKDHLVIYPRSLATTLVFVPEAQFSPVFSLSLVEEKSGVCKTVELFLPK